MTRLGRSIARAVAIAAAVSAGLVAAQTVPDNQLPGAAALDLPQNLQIYGKADPNVRKPTAIVNDTVVTGTDVDQRVAMIVALNKYQPTAEERDRLRLQIVRQLIDETLQIQEAKANEIAVTPQEIDQSMARLARQFNQTPVTFGDYLKSVGSSERSLRRQIEGELAWNRLLRRKVTPFINVSDEEVQGIIDRMKAQQGQPEYHVKEIYLSAPPERAAEVVANMRKMIDQMKGGAPFEYFAQNFSEASTRGVGGDLGWVRLAVLPSELQTAIAQLGVGQIAGPIEVAGGYSIVYLVDKRQTLTADPRDAVLALRQLTLKFPAGTTQAQATQRAGEFAKVSQTIRGCGDVPKVAATLGAEVVDNDNITIRQLPPQLQEIMTNLQIGQATPPFGSPEEGVRALVLCSREDAKAANLPTAEQVQGQIEESRVNLRAQRMLRDLRRDAIVEYR